LNCRFSDEDWMDDYAGRELEDGGGEKEIWTLGGESEGDPKFSPMAGESPPAPAQRLSSAPIPSKVAPSSDLRAGTG
jgi:hypothetical protein